MNTTRCEKTRDSTKGEKSFCSIRRKYQNPNSLFEQEKWKNDLDLSEKHRDTEVSLKNKEEELSMIIEELRSKFESDKQELAKEQVEKLSANDSLGKEKEARLAVEKAQVRLTEELGKPQGKL
ncbi:hypothetical protein Bca4012_017230 [Brassica carinata]